MKKLITLIFIAVIPLTLFAQKECIADRNDIYGTVALREYRLDRIDRGLEPAYEKDLPKGEQVILLDLYKGYTIVVYKSDTFTIKPKYLQSDCLSEKLKKIEQDKLEQEMLAREIEKQEWEKFLKQKILIQKQEKQAWEDSLKRGISYINSIYPTIARIDDIAVLSEINRDKKVFLHSRDSVELVGYKNDTAYVFHKGCLYQTVLKDLISPVVDSLLAIFTEQEAGKEKNREIALEQEAKRKKVAGIAAMNKRKANLIDKYGESIANLIIQHKVKIGMTKEMARESWGIPEDINKTTTQYGTFEQWVYGGGNYLYFDNGVLTTIQN